MNVLGVNPMKTEKQFKRSRRNKSIKVVYISSPMKVKTSASEFRALVQELTGRDSDAERYMEINGVGRTADQHQIMKSGHGRSNDFNFNINSAFLDLNPSTGLSEFSPVFHLQAFGNDQSIFS